MGPLLVIMAVFLIALVVNNVLLTERCPVSYTHLTLPTKLEV